MLMRTLLLFSYIITCHYCEGQQWGKPTESVHPDTLWAADDSFRMQFIYASVPDEDIYTYAVSRRDTCDLGTDGTHDLKLQVSTLSDTLVIPYTNLPMAQVLYIPIASPKGKTVYRLHFNSTCNAFTKEYVAAHDNTVEFEIPEVYELANIIWILSPKGIATTNIDTTDAYYKRVKEYFKPHMNHPVFAKFNFPDSIKYDKYYDFRENSYTYKFCNDDVDSKLVCEGPYYYVMGDDWDNFTHMFSDLLPLVEDFAKQSTYRKFYKDNNAYYRQLIQRQEQLMPLRKMWTWLEAEFPASKFNSYKVVFSPLITGSHSTQNFSDYIGGKLFREAVMFVCGPESRDADKKLTEEQKTGLQSGIVFTEIDHNYVNPASNKYRKTIDSVLSNTKYWAESKASGWYRSSIEIFNEYMTHSVFCLYIADNYDSATAAYVINKREELMVKWRGFTRFKEFNTALMEIRERNRDERVVELYPEIIAWCRQQ